MFASISINNVCNLRCKMCDIGQRNKDSSGMASNWDTDKVLTPKQWLAIFEKHGITKMHITGTEPLLYKHLPEFLKLVSPGRHIYLTTNGFKYSKENVDLLAKYCNELAISIDGSCAEVHDDIRGVKGSFDRAFAMLKDLKARGKKIKVSYAISPDNINDIKKAYDLFVGKLGIPVVFNHYNYIHPTLCKSSNMTFYDPNDVDLDILLSAIKHSKKAKFAPNLRNIGELKAWYQTIPDKRIKAGKGCTVFNATVKGDRCALNAAGDFIPSARCWMTMKLGSALTDEHPSKNNKFKKITKFLASEGIPPACQRLCCAGKTV